MEHRTVRLTQDNIERQAKCSPERAIEETMWNALDAGGATVEVVFEEDDLFAVKAIEIRDQGIGIPYGLVDEAFGTIGESLKLKQKQTGEGRALHGSEGRGRFKALVLGKKAIWTTTYADGDSLWQYRIVIEGGDEKTYSVSKPSKTRRPTVGTTLRIELLADGVDALRSEEVRKSLSARFALYLRNYPDVTLVYDRRQINPGALIARSETRPIAAPAAGTEPAEIEILEWKIDIGTKKLFLCDTRGFVWHEMPAGIHAPRLNLTGYLKCKQTKEWYSSGQLGVAELDSTISAYVEAAKEELRLYRRQRLAEEAKEVVAEWKRDKVYPYPDAEPRGPIERAERQVFDIVASRVHEFHEPLRAGDNAAKRLTLGLVRQALETNPTSLRKILESALSLPREKQNELAELLEITNFDAIIEASRVVTQRLDVIHGLEALIFSEDWRKRLLERTQLHRLLVHELWLFGEEYTLDNDDEPWKAVLQKHIGKLGRTDLAEDVDIDSIDGINKIPDLMLSRRFLRPPEVFENLVIELKRPGISLGSEEIVQIEEYAELVRSEPLFDKDRVQWTFILIGNDFAKYGETRANSSNLPYGCIASSGNLKVWIKRWSEVFHNAKLRYEFFRERLEMEASAERGLRYLNDNYEHLLAGKGMTKKQEVKSGHLPEQGLREKAGTGNP